MGQHVISPQALAGIPFGSFSTYLRTHGWREGDTNEAGSYWHQVDKDHDLQGWLPSNSQVKTFNDRIAQLLNTVADTEKRDVNDLVRDLIDLERDIQEVRMFPQGTPGSMGLAASTESVQGLKHWVESAAVSVALQEGSAVLPKKRPPEAVALVAATEMLTPIAGSFIWRLSVPLTDHTFPDQFPFQLGDDNGDGQLEDYSRRTTLHLLRSTRAVAAAATEVIGRGGDLESFKSRISDGVSADLCEALTQTSAGGMTPLEFNFKWSAARPVNEKNSGLAVSQEQLEIITWAGHELRREAIEEDVTIRGFIVRLSRTGPSDTPGKITIAGSDAANPGGPLNHFWVELSAEDYHKAGDAHAAYLEVSVIGDLKRSPKRRDILDPHNFTVHGPRSN